MHHSATLNATAARANLFKLMEQVESEHVPVIITGKKTNSILISEKDWRDIQETLFLISIPGMAKSIKKEMKVPLKECHEELDW